MALGIEANYTQCINMDTQSNPYERISILNFVEIRLSQKTEVFLDSDPQTGLQTETKILTVEPPGAEWPSGRLGDFPVGRSTNELKRTSLQTALRSRVKFMSGPLS